VFLISRPINTFSLFLIVVPGLSDYSNVVVYEQFSAIFGPDLNRRDCSVVLKSF
jgi:hypothetical protein